MVPEPPPSLTEESLAHAIGKEVLRGCLILLTAFLVFGLLGAGVLGAVEAVVRGWFGL